MTDLIHSPAGALAPPPDVQAQADRLKAQGFAIDHIKYGTCTEAEAQGRSGWGITLHDLRRYWFCWVFDEDVMADKVAIAVDVEVC
jgi:hypothetical protein